MKITIENVVRELKKRQSEQEKITKEIARLEGRQKKMTESTEQLFHDICQDAELATGLARAIEPRIMPGSEVLYLEAFSRGATPEDLASYLTSAGKEEMVR